MLTKCEKCQHHYDDTSEEKTCPHVKYQHSPIDDHVYATRGYTSPRTPQNRPATGLSTLG